MRLDAGTRQSTKVISAVSWDLKPILSSFLPFSKPGVPSSTAMSEIPVYGGSAFASVLAATSTRSQSRPLLMNVFWPLMMYASPSFTAVVRMDARSDPAPGSVMAMAVTISPLAHPGSQHRFCSSPAKL